MEYREITEKIIGCCYNVYNKMGFGFLESVYEKCLLMELAKAELRFESQKSIDVFMTGNLSDSLSRMSWSKILLLSN